MEVSLPRVEEAGREETRRCARRREERNPRSTATQSRAINTCEWRNHAQWPPPDPASIPCFTVAQPAAVVSTTARVLQARLQARPYEGQEEKGRGRQRRQPHTPSFAVGTPSRRDAAGNHRSARLRLGAVRAGNASHATRTRTGYGAASGGYAFGGGAVWAAVSRWPRRC
jgi:hypothetical protein